ncbi:hypothetical protein [Pseudoduganella violaceinigra]|uniref:hypothetical protein n=1 Tax=Pseudoduganella violaceinigra TaxID=246602 RepID=UPI00040C1376|nr:hypothetical protein [Pseudoduganella violaceinigra]
MKKSLTLILAIALAGCALPKTAVKTGAVRPTLAVQGAPEGAQLFVDGLPMGDASAYNGVSRKVYVEDGTHVVEVRQAGAVLLSQKIFARDGETSTVVVRAEEKK